VLQYNEEENVGFADRLRLPARGHQSHEWKGNAVIHAIAFLPAAKIPPSTSKSRDETNAGREEE
jgi:hypothetical protein